MTQITLFTKHQDLAVKLAQGYYLPGADEDDVRQEARIALWEAAGSFDRERGVPFRAFATDVMRRRLVDALARANRLKQRMLTDTVRTGTDRRGRTVSIIDYVTSRELPPDELVVQLEELRGVVGAILGLSKLERQSIVRAINGLGPVNKADDNALYRARQKLRQAS